MTLEDKNDPMKGSDNTLAAEYVVGVLSMADRRKVAARMRRDDVFVKLVETWEAKLSPLADSYLEVEPPATVKLAIDRILYDGNHSATMQPESLWQRLTFWRGLTSVAFALLIAVIAVPLATHRPPEIGIQLMALLAPKGSDVSYLAYYDPRTRQLSLSHLSGERNAGLDFELWAIEGQEMPISLGVIPPGNRVRVRLDSKIGSHLSKGGILAISTEPAGGSPTGQATGPVVAAGDLHQI
ncbi:MAG: anti-sigma factor [Rhizobiales bacterium]|nr:anti-sigma factor [Hyphomicrobiales bacterium]